MEYISFTDVYQDGIEVGDTAEVSVCYLLRTENPVEVAFCEFDEVSLGRVFEVK